MRQQVNSQAAPSISEKSDNSTNASPQNVFPASSLASIITQPHQTPFTPGAIRELQRTHGNRFVQRLIQHSRKGSGVLQRDAIKTDAEYKTYEDIQKMSLGEFHVYAHKQFNWFKEFRGNSRQYASLSTLLRFADEDNILAGCRSMSVQSLLNCQLIDRINPHQLSDVDAKNLRVYSAGVTGDKKSIEIAPLADVTLAIKWGVAMDELQSTLGGRLANRVISQEGLKALMKETYLRDFLNYYETLKPNLEDPSDILSYTLLHKGVDPLSYNTGVLKGRIKNFHRFTQQALETLAINFGRINLPNEDRKPLTLIIHSSSDHNGAFHRDSAVTELIKNQNTTVLLLEVITSLDAIQNELPKIAAAYGKDKKIAQVMIAGHGLSRSIGMMQDSSSSDGSSSDGSSSDGNNTISESQSSTADGSNTSKEAESSPANDGSTSEESTSKESDSSSVDEEVTSLEAPDETTPSENLSLNNNKKRTVSLFDGFIKEMASNPNTDPYRRIVFNACLTNSNEVTLDNMPWETSPSKQRRQVRLAITRKPSLVAYFRKRIKGDHIRLIGANGSTGEVILAEADGGLDIITHKDKQVTNPNKLAYVAEGTEPFGVMLAVMECWAGFGAEVGQRRERQKATFYAMQKRIQQPLNKKWDDAIIQCLFGIILKDYRESPEQIHSMANVARCLHKLQFFDECNVWQLEKAGLLPGGQFASHAVNIFTVLKNTKVWPDRKHVRLVVEQVWMMYDASHKANMMNALSTFTGQTVSSSSGDYLDYDLLEDHLPDLLKTQPHSAQILLACKFLVEKDNEVAEEFLKNLIGKGNRSFPPDLNINMILRGKPDEHEVLEALNLANDPQKNANFDLDCDGKNDIFIEPGYMRGAAVTSIVILEKPDWTSPQQTLQTGQIVDVLGTFKNPKGTLFYAIKSPSQKSGIAFTTHRFDTLEIARQWGMLLHED